MKKTIAVIILIGILFTLTGCLVTEKEASGVTLDNNTDGIIGKDALVDNLVKETIDMKTNYIIQFAEGINLSFTPVYTMNADRAENWLFTQSSSIDLGLGIQEIPENFSIMVSQVYADISLVSPYAKYNGIRQDSMNITYHDSPNGGISIRETDPYNMPFQIEAVDKNETFFYTWNGYGTSQNHRVTEAELARNVEGAVLNVVWTITIRDNLSGDLYIKTINDRVGIPYDRKPAPTTEQMAGEKELDDK